jgi:hypothetical protein
MAQDLQDLTYDIQRPKADKNVNPRIPFTEAEIKQLRTRMNRLLDGENSLLVSQIIVSLNYDSRAVRHESVPLAHKSTFQWAFDSRLADWLRSGGGIFWISGKPGSGKSTFMKFIASHDQTTNLLAEWAGPMNKLAIATHFFWIAGTAVQKSWLGLLRSLLFDVFHKHPFTVPLVSPHRWAAARAGDWQAAAEPWSVIELTAALRVLASAKDMPLKMCFFIDGLDEYDSDHTELCAVLRDMADSPRVKICLSSRPWAVFEDNFGGDKTERLDIHELTRNDIRGFVTDQLKTHPKWLAEEGPRDKDALVEQIAAQADGVFLWAFFVARALREGLSNGEMIADLHRRLSGLPTDLESLFKHMLEEVSRVDHPKMAGFLQAAAHALEPLHIDLYRQVENEMDERGYSYRCSIGAQPFEEVARQRTQTTQNINALTRGLLKVVHQKVEFLHRTAKDFVMTKDMGEYFRSKLPGDYNGLISISAAYLGLLKTTRQDGSLVAGIVRQGPGMASGPFISHLNQALIYASEALKSDQVGSDRQAMALLDAFEDSIDRMVHLGHVSIKGLNAEDCHPRLIFRGEILRHNLTPYLTRRLELNSNFFNIFDESPLFFALMPMSISGGESQAAVAGILDVLLRRGEDPNVIPSFSGLSDPASPWAMFARGVMSVFNMLSGPCMFPARRFNDTLDNGLFDLLLAYGANPDGLLINRRGAHTVFSHFLDISLSRFLGPECYDGYLRTLDAFMRADAALGLPPTMGVEFSSEAVVGNLARKHPDQSILTCYCNELQTLTARLAADPERARFISSVTEKLIRHCSGNKEYLEELSSAIAKAFPQSHVDSLLELIEPQKAVQGPRKRQRGSWGQENPGSSIKQLRGK